MMKLSKIALRNIARNRRRSILSVTAVAVATMSIVVLFGFIGGMIDDMEYNIQTHYTGEVRIRNKEFDELEYLNPTHLNIDNYKPLLSEIEKMDEVASVSPRIYMPSQIARNDVDYFGMGVGVDFDYEIEYQEFSKAEMEGRFPKKGGREALVGIGFAKELGLGIDDKFTMTTITKDRTPKRYTLKVVGIINYSMAMVDSKYFMLPLDRAQYIMAIDDTDSVQSILVKSSNGIASEKLAELIDKKNIETGYSGLSSADWTKVNTIYSWLGLAEAIYGVFAAIFFVLASTVIINTTMMVIFERMKEIGTIGAMGMTGGEIVRLFFTEAFYLGLFGATAGAILGVVAVSIMGQTGIDFSKAMEGVTMEVSNIVYPSIKWYTPVWIFFYSLIVTSFCSIWPSRRAAKIKPVEALRAD